MRRLSHLLLVLTLFSCDKQPQVVINTFTVGHLTLVDTLGPTRPINVKEAAIKREETIDFIYKVDSALQNGLGSVQLYNGYFYLDQVMQLNDSVSRFQVLAETKTDWKKSNSKVRSNHYELFALNNEVIRFDYMDGITVYRKIFRTTSSGGLVDTVRFHDMHSYIDSLAGSN